MRRVNISKILIAKDKQNICVSFLSLCPLSINRRQKTIYIRKIGNMDKLDNLYGVSVLRYKQKQKVNFVLLVLSHPKQNLSFFFRFVLVLKDTVGTLRRNPHGAILRRVLAGSFTRYAFRSYDADSPSVLVSTHFTLRAV